MAGLSALKRYGTGWHVQTQTHNVWRQITVEKASPAKDPGAVLASPFAVTASQTVMIFLMKMNVQILT